MVEAKLLGRNAVGVDVNPDSIKMSNVNLDFPCSEDSRIYTKQGNARDLSCIKDQSIDLICTHPPYADIIRYSKDISEDMSHLPYEEFLVAMADVAKESLRVLKEKGICSFMIGDIRRKGYVLPLGMNSMHIFTNIGFTLKEIIIKVQHNCFSSEYWNGREKSFLMLAHEYIFVLEK